MKATQFRTRTGRIIWTGADGGTNSLYDPCTKDFDENPLKPNDDGSPRVSYRLGLAIPKQPGETHWAQTPEGAIIWAQGHTDHPQAASGSDFSWKVQDGDSTVKTAKAKVRPCDKEGYPGHWVFTLNSGFPFKFCNADGSAYLLDKGAVKCGDYVQALISVVGNTGKSPGIYLNHMAISLQGLGDPITGGPDIKSAGFGQGPQPAGMTPVGNRPAGTPPPVPGLPPAAPGAAPPPPNAPVSGSAPPPPPSAPVPQQVPQVPVTPAAAFVGAPPAPGVAPPPPLPAAPIGPVMTPKAAGQSYAAFIAAGWTDATLRANGYII